MSYKRAYMSQICPKYVLYIYLAPSRAHNAQGTNARAIKRTILRVSYFFSYSRY